MNKTTRTFALGLLALAASTGACTTIRTITAETWWHDGSGLYVAYWEGKQMAFSQGDSKVQWCQIHKDNSLGCLNQAEVEKALNPKLRDK